MQNKYKEMMEIISKAIHDFYSGKPYRYIVFATELENKDGFAFVMHNEENEKAIVGPMRRMADKIENNQTFPKEKGTA